MHQTARVLVRVVDAHTGQEQWVEADPAVAEVLRQTEPPLKEQLFRRPKAIEDFTEAQARYWGGEGHAWEGPRMAFTLFVGEGVTWDGPASMVVWDEAQGAWTCRFCRGAVLPRYAACLGCCCTGRDRSVERPTALDLAKRSEGRKSYVPAKGLRGGKG